jgi:hypothetical protein
MSALMPNFFLIGANKAGTTSLHYYLSQHPDVFMSNPKEPRFFSAEYDRGFEYYRRTYFRGYGGERVVGDAATQHLYLPFVAKRIAANIHEPRFTVICRNPVDRLVSNYWHRTSIDLESRSFEEVIDLNLRLLAKGQAFATEREAILYANVFRDRGDAGLIRDFCFYIESGYYAQNIEAYRSIFGTDRIKILFFEDLEANPEEVTNELLDFLGLTPMSLSDARRLNEARSRSAARVVRFFGAMPGIGRIPPRLKTTVKQQISRMLKSHGDTKPPISQAARQQLAAHYRPHNRRLAILTGRSLDHWA